MCDVPLEAKEPRKKQPIPLRHCDVSLLIKLFAKAKNHDDKQTMRAIEYELRMRGKSIRKYSSLIKAEVLGL